MKKRSRLTALLLVLLLTLSAPVSALASTITYTEYQQTLQDVSEAVNQPSVPVEEESQSTVTVTVPGESIERPVVEGVLAEGADNSFTLPLAGKLVLSVAAAAESYQWQIRVDGVWASIVGENSASVTLTYAMLENALSGGTAVVRCCLNSETYSPEALICVDTNVSVTNTEDADDVAVTTYYGAAPVNKARAMYMPAALSEDGDTTNVTYSVVINYVFENGGVAASPYTASLAAGTGLTTTVTHPTVQGYLPYVGEATETSTSIDLNITDIQADVTYTVTYRPTNVDYTVIHYQQNVDNDNYTEKERETKQGLTNSTVPEVAKSYDGFYALLYEKPAIAADGSTVVEVYYDRYYYLMNFVLDGGYGVEPIYARYGAKIENVGTPTKAGYTFKGWSLDGTNEVDLPATMPAENSTYKALWEAMGDSSYSIVYFKENANDSGYTYWDQKIVTNQYAGTFVPEITESNVGMSESGFHYSHADTDNGAQIEIKGDNTTSVNVYFKRDTYSLSFQVQGTVSCGKDAHVHGPSCTKSDTLQCGMEEHSSHTNCGLQCSHKHSVSGCFTFGNDNGYKELTAKPNLDSNGPYINGQVYTYTEPVWYGTQPHYYAYVDGKWYCGINRRGNQDDTVKITSSCPHTEHTDDCYTCGKKIHTHNDSCYYNCSKEVHIHGVDCTIGNGNSWITTITFEGIKYGQDTTQWWSQAPEGYRWKTTKDGNTAYTAAPDMPNGNLTVYGQNVGTSYKYIIHYYEENTTSKVKPDNEYYLEYGSGNPLATPKITNEDGKPLTGLYGAVVSESAIDIANYTAVAPTAQTLTIKIEEGETANLNVITFYYKENEATINYVAVGPDNVQLTDTELTSIGYVAPPSEQVKVITGTAKGSTATLIGTPAYKFVGWYSDAECKTKVSDAATYVPTQPDRVTNQDGSVTNGLWPEQTTYYAKFEYNLTTLTIKKSGMESIDAGQSFLFNVKGYGLPNSGLTIAINGNGSETISGLTVGQTYTVTEVSDWSWRYTANVGSKTLTSNAEDNVITITNSRNKAKWLDGDCYEENVFGSGN